MNKVFIPRYIKRAAISVCLFLCLTSHIAISAPLSINDDETWIFDTVTQKAYDLVLNLQLEEVHLLIPAPETAQEHYVTALAEALELLITEDGEQYTEYETRFNQRLDRKTKTNVAEDLFLQAEIRMQWTFVYLKFGHEFDAALNLRQAYLTIEEIKKRFPKFQAIKKSSGLLQIIIASVPQKYNWVLSLLNMEGSSQAGFKELENILNAESPLAFEAHLVHALVQGFLLQKPDTAVSEIQQVLVQHPDNRLALFLGAALSIKNAQSEEALTMLEALTKQTGGIPIHYADYLRGEIYLSKGEYLSSISAYRWFINNFRGQNGIKDSHYKIGLCYWLNGNTNDALASFKQARAAGKEASESDKYAARSLAESELPHIKLSKARYAMDGGYYDKSKEILEGIGSAELPTQRDKVEFHYRRARLAHKLGELAIAKQYYLKSIEVSQDKSWYYAPNACLQLGYITWAEGDLPLARNYFTKALSYNKHEYKNSIDSKAKSAIAQIKRK